METLVADEGFRAAQLIAAEEKAVALFEEVDRRGIITAGVGERAASDAIRDLAVELFDTKRFWHKRIVRAGPNTLHPYEENPPDRLIESDDIIFLDFGPIFEEWEADFGRTFVLGDDPIKQRIRDDLSVVWHAGKAYFDATPDITGEQLYGHMVELAAAHGWEFGGMHSGHLVGQFPHEKIAGDEMTLYITDGSTEPMRRTDRTGRLCHWILEVHLVDRERGFGGFYEQLLDLSPSQ